MVPGTAPANPAPNPWTVVNDQSHSAPNAAFTNDVIGTYAQYPGANRMFGFSRVGFVPRKTQA